MIKHMNLQLFAESPGGDGGAPAPAAQESYSAPPAASEGSTPAPASSPSPAQTSSTPATNSGVKPIVTAGDLAVVINPQTGRREIKTVPKQQEAQATPAGEPQEYKIPQQATTPAAPTMTPPAQQQTDNGLVNTALNGQQPSAYTPQELTVALQLGNVDETRIPAQFQQQYETYKQAKTAAAQPQPQEQTPPAPTAEQERAKQMEFYRKVDELADKNAMQELNITQEDLDNAEYSDDQELLNKVNAYKVAKDWHKNNIISQVQARTMQAEQEQAQKQAQTQAVYGTIANFVNETRAKEPNFDKIDIYMNTRYKTLPFEEGQKVAVVLDALRNRTLTEAQLPILEKYYNDTRLDFYAQNNNISTTPQQVARPAVVETPGGGGSSTPAQIDYSELRNADFRGKQAFIAKLFAGKKQ